MVLRPGFEPGSPARKAQIWAGIEWKALRNGFIEYLASKQYSEAYRKDLISYLDRYVKEINGPTDIIKLFSSLKAGRRHLWLALRALFNYLEVIGFNLEYLDILRKSLPKVKCGLDLKIPAENEIIDSLKRLKRAPLKYQALYRLILDSGLRATEAVKVIREFDPENAENVNGFYRIPVGQFRGSKQAYFAYFTEKTFQLLKMGPFKVETWASTRYFRKMGYIPVKYLRKFAFDKMIELEIPESIADFIQGRVPRKIGAKHYMSLIKQADRFYGRYARYISKL